MTFVLSQGHQYLIHTEENFRNLCNADLCSTRPMLSSGSLSQTCCARTNMTLVSTQLFYRLDTFYRLHSLCMVLMLYCLLCFPHSQEGIKFTCTVCGVQGQCWWRPLGKVQISLLYTDTQHKSSLLPILTPFPAHYMARTHTHTHSHQHTAAVLCSLPNACGSTDIPVPGHTVGKCNNSGSEESKDHILFGSKALSWTASGNSR